MSASEFDHYAELIARLKKVVRESDRRIRLDLDELMSVHLNFFAKSYLILLCTYLEAFLQDIAFQHVLAVRQRMAAAQIPHNVVHWYLLKGNFPEKNMNFCDLSLSISKKDIAEEISGNPGRTIRLFRNIGIDLRKSEAFEGRKELVGAIVNKRNNIVHHNDSAADVSMSDLLVYADQILSYMKAVSDVVAQSAVAAPTPP